ncbi:MAG: metallopeptidase family protein [Dehalococcoidia bacterium]|jgi:predicted Zn-dependent protease with MMP-like domain
MRREKFEELVLDAISNMPEEFKELLENIDIVVEDWPSNSQIKKLGLSNKYELLGLYEGIPRTRRDHSYNLALPDKITIFQKPLEADCSSVQDLKQEIIMTVKHEIAHYFGLDDDRLDEIENGGDT